MKVGIIGGGACGLVLANILEEAGVDYELFEKSLCARKILASGNGKANIGNTNIGVDCYNHSLGYELVRAYQERINAFFKKIHLAMKTDEAGRIYPYSESSLTVVQCLLRKKLKIVENFPVQSITKMNHKYYFNDVRGPFDMVVLCSGSMASFIPKKQEGFMNYLNSLNLKMVPLKPSLVGFKLKCDFKRLNGVRLKTLVSLKQYGHVLYQEQGEVILKQDGISGISILNCSSYYQRLENKKNCTISLNLIPSLLEPIETELDIEGILPPKLVEYFKNYSFEEQKRMLTDFEFEIIEPYDFEFAQVVAGGISLEEINDHLSLKKDTNIYVGGELLDVDGICGGYNLMFAFACALKIGEELCNIKSTN